VDISILQDTGIGKVVNNLKKSENADESVVEKARSDEKNVYEKNVYVFSSGPTAMWGGRVLNGLETWRMYYKSLVLYKFCISSAREHGVAPTYMWCKYPLIHRHV
jgi:hypothetical protein